MSRKKREKRQQMKKQERKQRITRDGETKLVLVSQLGMYFREGWEITS